MGKYVKKGKISGDVSLMEVPQSALGVRTRARTLALQQSPDFCYLQLRSRRLEKPIFPPMSPTRKQEKQDKTKETSKISSRSDSRLRVESVNPVSSGPKSFRGTKKGEVEVKFKSEVDSFGVETSFGENNFELDGAGRSTRESTPCSLMRSLAGSIGTPGSTVRSTYSGSANQGRVQDCVQRSAPSTREIEDFFANAEKHQQKQFMDKYNFDILNDLPLPGRFEWVRVDP